jgi:VCBS repeat-containing protein
LLQAQALEPRILLDAAGLVTVGDAADNADAEPAAQSDTGEGPAPEESANAETDQAEPDIVAAILPQTEDDAPPQDGTEKNEIAFIDPNVEDFQTLLEGLRSGVEAVVIDGDQDGFDQMAQILSQRQGVDAIHILSHGASGQIGLGTAVLESSTLETYSDALEAIKGALTEEGDVLIYGCDVASGEAGAVFLGDLAEWTGSDVAASSDTTGSSQQGGDWVLEMSSGPIETTVAIDTAALSEYDGVLAGAATDIVFSNYTIEAGNSVVNTLGGTNGFDTQVLATNLTPQSLDDGYMQIDISSVFGDGLKFGDTTYDGATDFYVGTNGYVTFGHHNTSFSSVGIPGYTQGPMIAGQFDDIDLSDSPAQSAGGNSAGSHSLYYDIDTTNNVVTITFDDVGPYNGTAGSGDQNTGNAFQIRLHQIDGSDFAIELRYENVSWANGNSGFPTAGWTAGDQVNYGEVTGSGTTDFLNVETASNMGQNGIFVWEVRDGTPLTGQNTIPEDAAAGTFVSSLEITDADAGETHTCTLLDDDGGRFELYQDGGVWKVRVAAGATFDYETSTTRNITVRATGDTDGLSFDKVLTINISDVNEAPTSADKTVNTNEDTAYTFAASDFSFSDPDNGAALDKVQVTSLETAGSLQYNAGTWQDVTLNQEISKADIDAGKLRFSPAANANGASYDSFDFKVSDGSLYSAASYTMTVDVTAVNDAPTAADSTVTANEDAAYTFAASDFSFSDVDAGAAMDKVQITSLEGVGTLEYDNAGTWEDVTLNQEVSKADIDAGKLRFTPVAGENGAGYDAFGFKVNDGTVYSAAAYTMTVDVANVNDPPTDIALSSDSVTEEVPGDRAGTLTATDPDPGDTAAFSIVDDPSGLFEISGSTLKLKAGASADFETAASHTLTIRITDSQGATFDKDFVITVVDADDGPAGNSPTTPYVPLPDTSGTPPPPPVNDVSFLPTFEGNQIVQGALGQGTVTPGEGPSIPTGGASAMGITPVTPSRGGTLPGGGPSAGIFTGDGGAGLSGFMPGTGDSGSFFGGAGSGSGGVFVDSGISNMSFDSGGSINFGIPDDAFSLNPSTASVTYQAMLADGSPLPQWISFSPETGLFTGTPPEGGAGVSLEIVVTIQDEAGNEAAATFRLEIRGEQGTPEPSGSLDGPPDPTASGGDVLAHETPGEPGGDAENGGTGPMDTDHPEGTAKRGTAAAQSKPSFSNQLRAAGAIG